MIYSERPSPGPSSREPSLCREMRRIYPDWLHQPYSNNAHALAETLGRIADRNDGWAAEQVEMKRALRWCRANGNPHLKGEA